MFVLYYATYVTSEAIKVLVEMLLSLNVPKNETLSKFSGEGRHHKSGKNDMGIPYIFAAVSP